jgi:hypothetical protein
VVLSLAARELAAGALPDGVGLRDLGEHRLKDLDRPERLFQLLIPGLPADFPALRSVAPPPNNLPAQLTSFVGRERELAEVKGLLAGARLLTLTGAAGRARRAWPCGRPLRRRATSRTGSPWPSWRHWPTAGPSHRALPRL